MKSLGLKHVAPRTDEDLFVKVSANAFSPRNKLPLAEVLLQNSFRKLIITGMNTRYCISRTINGALDLNFKVIAIYDQMADDCCKPACERKPNWHKRNLFYDVDRPHARRVPVMTRKKALQTIARSKPALFSTDSAPTRASFFFRACKTPLLQTVAWLTPRHSP